MKSIYAFGVFFAAFCLITCAAGDCFAQNSFVIVPGLRVGAIRRNSSEADLKRIYGQRNVRAAEVSIGEGEFEPGTAIYPDDPARTIEIIWKDAQKKRFPKSVHLTGDAKSVWKTRQGIGLETSLKELERINGRAFVLLGFGWDYAGTIASWKGGKLQREFGKSGWEVIIRLGYLTNQKMSIKEEESITGDIEISSAKRVIQRINPRIYQIVIVFP